MSTPIQQNAVMLVDQMKHMEAGSEKHRTEAALPAKTEKRLTTTRATLESALEAFRQTKAAHAEARQAFRNARTQGDAGRVRAPLLRDRRALRSALERTAG